MFGIDTTFDGCPILFHMIPLFHFFLILFPTLDVFSFLESKKLGSEEDGMNGKKMMKGESGLSGGGRKDKVNILDS